MKNNYALKVRMLLWLTGCFLMSAPAWAQFPDPYCAEEFPSNVESITLVSFAGINNPSANTIGGDADHEDFTSIVGTVTPTVSYPIILKGNTDGAFTNYFSVFIDWNGDGTFDIATEGYGLGFIYDSNGLDNKEATGNIIVPADAIQGQVRMRVIKKFNDYGLPCNASGYGQAEDYTITITAPPACLSPDGLALSGVAGSSTATIIWEAATVLPVNDYEYYLSTTNTAPAEATAGIDVAGTTLNLTQLPPDTTHYIWVRSDCGVDGVSAWSQVFQFRTDCVPVTAPYTQEFSTGTIPGCWTTYSVVNTGNALWKFTGSVEYATGNTRPAGTFAWVDGSDPSDGVNDVTLSTPLIDLTALTSPQLVFDYFSNRTNPDYENNIFTVQVYDGMNWNTVFSDNTNSAIWRTITVPLTGYEGDVIKVRFVVDKTANAPGYAFYNDILLDNVIVQETPACAAPTALHLTDANPFDVEVAWTAAIPAPSAGYEYELRTSGAAGSGATGLADSGTTPNSDMILDQLTPDTDYTLYIRSSCGTSLYSAWVSLPVSTIPVPPANDDCAGAIALTVNPDFSCAATTNATTVSATETMDSDPCYGNPDDDVWFTFEATSTSHRISLTNIIAVNGTSTDMYFQVLEGDCGGLTSVACSDPESAIVNNLVPGDVYYVRVYSYYTSTNTFTICVGTPPAAPANDDCAGAVELTVNPDTSCTVKTSGTTMSATLSMDATPCSGNPDDDVWFSFEATADTHIVSLSDVTPVLGFSTDMYFQVLEGTCDGTFTSLLCSDPDSGLVTGLTAGNQYFVRVYSYYGDSRQDFKICIGTIPPPPANDECDTATALTVNANLDCTVFTPGTTAGATNSMDQGPCYGDPDDDVWYSFEAIAEEHSISITNIVSVIGGSTDMYMQVFDGTCGTLTSLECSDYESLMIDELIPGNTYYIRVYSYGTGAAMNFNICVGTVPPPPANDDCAGAIALTPGGSFNSNPVIVSNGGATGTTGVPAPGCASYVTGDVWYTVQVPASGSITVETNSNPGSPITDSGLALYSGSCASMTLIECDDDDSADGNFSLITLTNRTAGEIIYVRVWEYNGDAWGTFKLSAYDASLSSEDFNRNTFKYYPNPVQDVLNLEYDSEITSVAVYNILGQEVLNKTINATNASVDMSALADGTYIVNVAMGDMVKTVKVIKNK